MDSHADYIDQKNVGKKSYDKIMHHMGLLINAKERMIIQNHTLSMFWRKTTKRKVRWYIDDTYEVRKNPATRKLIVLMKYFS